MDIKEYCNKNLYNELEIIRRTGRAKEFPELDEFEKTIIYKYSDDGYEILNEELRLNFEKNNSDFGKFLETSLEKLPNLNKVVYRSAYLSNEEIEKYIQAEIKNTSVKENSFISATTSKLIATLEFKGNVLFMIFSRTGKSIEKITKFGIYDPPSEKEVLFTPNSEFRILGIQQQQEYLLITMEEI